MVSVIMGVNRDDGSLLHSIESILCQTHNYLEFVIVNVAFMHGKIRGLVVTVCRDRIASQLESLQQKIYSKRFPVGGTVPGTVLSRPPTGNRML